MDTYILLQHYWWFLISLLGALLVFLLFVQGGQGLLYTIGKTEEERNMIVNSLGRKWELTFTTLVTFGGAFFASFPLFYSTSFGGAFYVWMLILFVFVIQAVAYEFRRKPDNFLGEKSYNAFLIINGVAGAFLLGAAVGTLFTGANFTVDRMNLGNYDGVNTISQWTNSWRGLDALADYRNWALGLSVLFLSRILGLQYFMNDIDDTTIASRSRKHLVYNTIPFLACFLTFLISLLFARGYLRRTVQVPAQSAGNPCDSGNVVSRCPGRIMGNRHRHLQRLAQKHLVQRRRGRADRAFAPAAGRIQQYGLLSFPL